MSEKKVVGPAEANPVLAQHPPQQPTDLITRILQLLGNRSPSPKQRQLIKRLLFNITFEAKLIFDKRLAPREEECLLLAALGYSSKQTAEILSIKQKTVEESRSNAKKKLGCQNMPQLVLQGMRYGYILSEQYQQNPVKIRENNEFTNP